MAVDFEERTPVLAARVRYLQAQLDLHKLHIQRQQKWATALGTFGALATMLSVSAIVIVISEMTS